MSDLPLGPQDCLFYEYREPQKAMGYTFVFFNALTGDISSWEDVIGPMVRKKGHGTLAYNMRGQSRSRFSQDVKLDSDLIVKDAGRLLEQVKPVRPVFVGLSIGGLFAATGPASNGSQMRWSVLERWADSISSGTSTCLCS